MNRIAEDVIYLASCAVNSAVPDTGRIEGMNLPAVYALASRHMITAAVAFALESAGVRDKRSGSAIAGAMRRSAIFDAEWSAIRSKLEQAGIWYMPLKGAVLKNMYPRYGMREFSDYDILFDASRAEDVKAVMVEMGYDPKYFGRTKHDSYYKEPVLYFEMHRALFGESLEDKRFQYYQNVESRLLKGPGYERRFTPEDFYLYCLAHESRHYEISGTGLRSLMDTYVYLSKTDLDMDYVTDEAEKLGIREFEERNRSLSLHLFTGEALTDADREMLEYILSSGTYGTVQHEVENKMRKTGWSKIQYALNRFFAPVNRKSKSYAAYARIYPFFYKYKIFLPFLPFYRTFRAILSGRFKAEARAIKNVKG